mgnify:FL=1
MFKLINQRRHIYVIAGVFLCSLFFILLGLDLITVDRYLFDGVTNKRTLIVAIVSISLLGPIVEEVSFRLNIKTKNKWLLLISFLFASIFIFLSFQIILSSLLFLAFLFSILFYLKSNKSYALDIQIIVTSVIFSLLHFTGDSMVAEDLVSLIIFFLYFLGMGLIFAWLRINYKFYSSVIAHILLNSFLMILAIYPSLNSETKTIECDELQFSYNERHIFNGDNSEASFDQDTLVFKNSNIIYMLDLYLQDADVMSRYIQTNGLINYDLRLQKFYDTSPQDILDCLEEHQLIKKKSSNRVDFIGF